MKGKRLLRSRVFSGLIFILMPLIVSLIMYKRMVVVLEHYMEKQVTEQAEALGQLASEKISGEIAELERVAGYYQDGRVSEEAMGSSLERLLLNDSRISAGILKLGGVALYGEELRTAEYPAVQRAFRGYNTVRYREGEGLLFTVPVYNHGNIKYVLYELCDENKLFSSYDLKSYGGSAEFLLADANQQKMFFVDEAWESDDSFFLQDSVKTALNELKEKLSTDTSAAVCYDSSTGRGFLFVAELGQGNLYVMGRVPYSAVAGSIDSLSILVLLVFGLLLVLLCLGTLNMLSATAKLRESDELREAKRAAEEANKTKSRFLANMSHELRTPINVILGMNEMILRDDPGEVTRERAMDIKGAAQIFLGLINDVLDFSKIESGNLNIISTEYNLISMIRDLVLLSENRARQKSLNFKLEIQPDLPVGLYGDDIHIRQVIINLLTNAVKYTEEGTVTLKLTGEKKDDETILFHWVVADTGIGIKEEDIEKMFMPYIRVEEERNRNVEGTGLGLSIIINLLKMMGSELKVESVYGEGSVFSFDLEQKIVDHEPVGDIDKRLDNMARDYKYHASFIAPKARILMVDDNSMNRRIFVSLLSKTQVQITTVSSGKKALELVQHEYFDIIFMDYLMPGLNGEETLRCMRELENNLCKDTPIIALTANAFSGSREHYMNMGFDDFLSKPIVTEKLEAMIRDFLPDSYLGKAPEEDQETASETVTEENGRKETLRGETAEKKASVSGETEADLPEVNGVNWMYAQMFLSDKNLLLTTLQEYYENIDTVCGEVARLAEEAGKENDETEGQDDISGQSLTDYRICVHSLKSNSALVGILSVSEIAKLLEAAAREGEREKIRTLTPVLLEELKKIKANLEPFMEQLSEEKSKEEEEKTPADVAMLLEYFEMLRYSMEQTDVSGTDFCMEQIRSHSYTPELQEIVDRIGKKAADLDYEGAKREMENAEKTLREQVKETGEDHADQNIGG